MNKQQIDELFSTAQNQDQGFFKTTVDGTARAMLDAAQKAALNRKGNVLYNAGDIEGARRIFLTTGYSDGIARIGDYYRSKGRQLDALRMYLIAPDRKKADAIIEKLASVIQTLLDE
ncbi:MAG: hypothetical protein LBO67_05655 [Spirochaetaceae bacterium]|nr:hypothetical protein [Spirochaetaceae bacterium]